MKQNYLFTTFFLLTLSLHAQVITIPDLNFKNALSSSNLEDSIAYVEGIGPIIVDSNQNGQIEQSEVLQITHLYLENLEISSLEGIEHFINLKILDCADNAITALDLRNNTQLIGLDCDNNLLTSLDIRNTNIVWLYANNNQISELLYNVSTPNWMVFQVAYNRLNTITIPKIHSWDEGMVDISGNFYTTVDFPAGMELRHLGCVGTQLISLDLSNIGYFTESLVIKDNPNLQYISIKNGDLEFCTEIDGMSDCEVRSLTIDISNNPALQFMCVDDMGGNLSGSGNYTTEAEYFRNFAPSVSSYCSFTPGGNYNTIRGTITFDADGNGCSTTDAAAKSIRIIQNTEDSGSTFTNENGQYTTYIDHGNLTLTPQFENPYYSVLPTSFTSAFSGSGNAVTADFCIVPNGTHADFEVFIVPISAARPGFDAVYHIIYKNKGNQTLSGNVSLDFNDAILDHVSANPAVDTQSTHTLTWNFNAFAPFESKTILVTLNLNSPMETPAVNIDDVLNLSATVSGSQNDSTPQDNVFVLNQTVVGSFDPNDKLVAEGATIGLSEIDKYLHYTVRFQNTGTAAATNVVVTDVIQDQLDANSLQILSASHPYVAKMNNKKLEFVFEGIDLPAASTDEPASHGFVTFKVKPAGTVGLGSTMSNTAHIFFDYNFPIATNLVSTTVSTLATNAFGANDQFVVYPNPIKNMININSKCQILSAKIYTMLGQLVTTITPDTYLTKAQIPAEGLKTGTYLLEIHSANGISSQKLIKF